VKTVLSYVVGTSRFPYIPEFIAGVWPWYLNPAGLDDEEFVTKAALMQGIKGFSRYMLVERNRWLNSPVRSDGRVREDHAAMFERVNEIAVEAGFLDLQRQADVLLLANRDYDRLEAASVLVSFPGDFLETPSGFSEYPTFMTVSERSHGFGEPIQTAKAEWFTGAYDGLNESGFAYLISDTALSLERWERSRVAVVSSFEFMAGEAQRKLVEFATAGGTVVLGPRLPQLDEQMRPDETLLRAVRSSGGEPGRFGTVHPVGAGRVVHLTDFSNPRAALDWALGEPELLRFARNDPRLDVTVHAPLAEDGRRLVYVANPTSETIQAEISLTPAVTFVRELWQDRPIEASGTLREELAPYTIGIYESRL
jgi:beta-galactosidase